MRTNNIAELRKTIGMTQKDLADRLGTAQTTVSGWERGAYEPDISQLDKMANIFNVTIGYLMGYEESTRKPATAEEMYHGEAFEEWKNIQELEKEFRPEAEVEYEKELQREKEYSEFVLRQNWLKSNIPVNFEGYFIDKALDNMKKSDRSRLLKIAQLAFPDAFTMIFEGD